MIAERLTPKKLFVLVSFIVWTLVALLDFARIRIMVMESSIIFQDDRRVVDFAVSAFIKFYIWFVLSIFIYDIFQKLSNKKLLVRIFLLFLVGVFSISIHYIIGNLTWNLYLSGPVDLMDKLGRAMRRFFSNMPMSSLIYAAILLIMIALDINRKYKEQFMNSLALESELSKAQLNNLKMQLRPHFIFNALNTISMLVRKKNNQQAVEMISGMSDLLRTTLGREDTQLVKLSYELELLKKYLAIEELRFKERLEINFDIDPDTLEAWVPNLILQPIVENAFKHGFSENFGASSISIKSSIFQNELHLTIINSGPELAPDWNLKNSQGIGIRNTVSRIEKLYGERARFSISNFERGGVIAELVIPLNSKTE